MVEKIFSTLRQKAASLHHAAFVLGTFAFLSQLTGLFRDRMLAHVYGAGRELDLYYTAFRIPDLIFVSVASLVSISVLVPLITQAESKGRDEVRGLVHDVFLFFSLIIIFAGTIAFFVMPLIAPLVFRGFSAEEYTVLEQLSRVLLLSPVLLGFSNLLGSLAQAHERFIAYAAAPIAYNIGIIVGIVFFRPWLGIVGVACGVALGAFLHLLLQIPSVRYLPFPLKISLRELIGRVRGLWMRVKEILALSLSRTLSLSVTNIALIALVSLGTTLGAGSVAVFIFASNLQSVPLSIIGVSYSVAAFPVFARIMREEGVAQLAEKVALVMRSVIFWALPATVFFIVLRAHIVRVVLGSGSFSWEDTRLTAAVLALFVLSLLFQALSLVFLRAFYACGDHIRSLSASLVSGVVTVMGAYTWHTFLQGSALEEWLFNFLKISGVEGNSVIALPIGFALGACVQCVFLAFLLKKQVPFLSAFPRSAFLQPLIASLCGGFVSYGVLLYATPYIGLDTLVRVFSLGALAGSSGILFWVGILALMKNKELLDMLASLTGKVAPQQIVAETDPMAS